MKIVFVPLAILQVARLVFDEVFSVTAIDERRSRIVDLAREESGSLSVPGIPVLDLKELLVTQNYQAHVAEVVHLLLLIVYAAIWHSVIRRTELCVHIIARDKDVLEALVRDFVIRLAKDGNIVADLVPV